MIIHFQPKNLSDQAIQFLRDVQAQYEQKLAGSALRLDNGSEGMTLDVTEDNGVCNPIRMPNGWFAISPNISSAFNAGKMSAIDAINAIGADYTGIQPSKPKRGRPPKYGEKMTQTAFWLRADQQAWLKTQPDVSELVRNLIDQAMKQG